MLRTFRMPLHHHAPMRTKNSLRLVLSATRECTAPRRVVVGQPRTGCIDHGYYLMSPLARPLAPWGAGELGRTNLVFITRPRIGDEIIIINYH